VDDTTAFKSKLCKRKLISFIRSWFWAKKSLKLDAQWSAV